MKKIIFVFIILSAGFVFYSCESNDSPVTNNTPVSTVPILLSPANNSTISNLSPAFDWSDLNFVTNYQLQVSDNSSFSNPILNISGLSSSQYTPSGNILNDSTTYFWRARGTSSTDTTAWSNTFSFGVVLQSINPTNKILVELFTNTSCIPCVEANQYLDGVYNLSGVTNNDASVIIVRYHTTLYAGDPFYLYNTTDNNARMAYYPNSAIVNPRTFLLGSFMGNFSNTAWTNTLNDKLASTRTFAIVLNNTYDTVSRNGSLDIKIKQASGPVVNDLVYHIAITENDIAYPAPNGETHFNNTLRDLITPPNGQPFSISTGQINSYSAGYSIAGIINQHKTDLTVFVQSLSTKEVFAVEKIKLP